MWDRKPQRYLWMKEGSHQDAPSTRAELHDKHTCVAKIMKAFKLLNSPLVPAHQKYTQSKPMGHDNEIHALRAHFWPLEPPHIYVGSKCFSESCTTQQDLPMRETNKIKSAYLQHTNKKFAGMKSHSSCGSWYETVYHGSQQGCRG